MVRIDCLIFGYRKIKINADDLSKITSTFINNGISSTIGNDGTIIVRERDYNKIRNIMQGRMEFSISEPMGIYGKWIKLRHKKTLFVSLVISLLIFMFSSNLIWDIRVEGNESIPDSEIVYELSKQGLEVGGFWKSVDKSAAEYAFLRNNEKISWININRRGTVAYVNVIEQNEDEKNTQAENTYTNIVANEDAVIEEITVKSGTVLVKPGDVVKKGDILIAGIYSTESGGLCRAEGSVIGRVDDRIEVNLMRNQDVRVQSGRKIYSVTLKFFKFSLNIFKLYRNLTNECDIIDYEKSYSLFGKYKLPFSIHIKYITEYSVENATYSDSDIVKVASNRLNALMASRLVGCDLIKVKTKGDFTDNGYYICSDVTFLCPIGESKAFEAD